MQYETQNGRQHEVRNAFVLKSQEQAYSVLMVLVFTNYAPPLIADFFYTARKYILWPHFLMIKKLKSFKYLTKHKDI